MKFIKLESRGGNYLVVAENVAWLRTAENGQTSVGIIGGQPLLVVGSIEEVAEIILSATAGQDEPLDEPEVAELPVSLTDAPAAPLGEEDPAPAAEAEVESAEQPMPEPVAAKPPQPEAAPPAPEPPAETPQRAVPEAVSERPPLPRAPDRPRPVRSHSMSLADRVARASAPKIKVETQRFMGLAE